ncbi:hypothetical protein QWA68_000794 [Fusarium oxysporum]|nr:hypothetical protein QWA68_000794 [Fusarium oxysporum]
MQLNTSTNCCSSTAESSTRRCVIRNMNISQAPDEGQPGVLGNKLYDIPHGANVTIDHLKDLTGRID